jgi:hypothetical protein
VVSLREHIVRKYATRRAPRKVRRQLFEDVGETRVINSGGLKAASVALPAGIDLEDRAARMNDFWKALVDFQHRDVFVVALCKGEER